MIRVIEIMGMVGSSTEGREIGVGELQLVKVLKDKK